jgi:hypothetical protein
MFFHDSRCVSAFFGQLAMKGNQIMNKKRDACLNLNPRVAQNLSIASSSYATTLFATRSARWY